jgi:hypothetical protein
MSPRVCQLDLEMQQNIKIKKVSNICSALKVEITPFMRMYQDCGVTPRYIYMILITDMFRIAT